MAKILVTGAAGFIGSYLSRALLSQSHQVHGLDNFSDYYQREAKEFNLQLIRHFFGDHDDSDANMDYDTVYNLFEQYYPEFLKVQKAAQFSFRELDILDKDVVGELIAKFKPDVIVHLAALAGVRGSESRISEYVQTNIQGTVNILEANREIGAKVVFASSSSIYGNSKQVPFTEDQTLDPPSSPYAATKIMQEQLNATYRHLFGMHITDVRIFGPVYGPLQRPKAMAAQKFIRQAAQGKPITIYGDGKIGGRDTTYIDDIVTGFQLVIEKYLAEDQDLAVYSLPVNIGSSQVITPADIAVEVAKHYSDVQIDYIDRSKIENDITQADISLAKQLFDYEPSVEFSLGMQRQIEVFEAMPNWYQQIEG